MEELWGEAGSSKVQLVSVFVCVCVFYGCGFNFIQGSVTLGGHLQGYLMEGAEGGTRTILGDQEEEIILP